MISNPHVLITDRFAVEAEVLLTAQPGWNIRKSAGPTPTSAELAEAEILIVRSRTRVDSNLLAQAPRLRMVITATSGFDHLDLQSLQNAGVRAWFTPEGNAASAAELTWALVLSCARHVVKAHRAVKAGDWKRELLIGTELSGKTYGVVGFGRIGRRVARIARAMNMNVLIYDPYIEESDLAHEHVTRVSLEEILRQSDVLSFHVPKTRETHHLINRSTLESIHHGVILINTSRGSVFHEEDVVWGLEKGWIRAVGMDVFEKEPLPRSARLLSFDNVITTPHVGATTEEAFRKVSVEAAQKVLEFCRNGTAADELPPQALWYQMGSSPHKS